MKKINLNKILQNDRIALILSFVCAFAIWVGVVGFAGPETTRVVHEVGVTIDESGLSQFGLQVFGDKDFYADVTVRGKKYNVSSTSLSKNEIVVNAITTEVDSAGYYTLQLKAEPASGNTSFTVTDISPKTVRVYFDTEKTAEFVVEPQVVADGFPIAKEGFNCGEVTSSEPIVTVKGPAAQVDKISKVVAKVILKDSLKSHKSEETELIALDKKGKQLKNFIDLSVDKTVVKIPIMRVKTVKSVVTFKNIPTAFITSPLKYKINPSKGMFNILVDDYDKATEYSVGVIDFKFLSPSNNKFKFDASDTATADDTIEQFNVVVDMKGYSQEYITVPTKNIKVNNPEGYNIKVSGLNKSVVVVGKEADLKKITEDMIKVDVDLSLTEIKKGQTITVPAEVTVNNGSCWAYGVYEVKIQS